MAIEWEVRRQWFTEKSSIGALWIAGQQICFTLEDAAREVPGQPVAEWKIPHETAIPVGRYQVVIDDSVRFKRPMPHLLDVPGYEGVRIHSGNTAADTEGCLLVGTSRGADAVLNSRVAFNSIVFPRLQQALEQDEVWLTVGGLPPQP